MKANEIRLGSYVIDVFNPKNPTERQIDFDDLAMLENYKNHPLPFKPIPLTEEWLLKFGFLKCDNGSFYISFWGRDYYYNDCTLTMRGVNIQSKIEYVHQLQNLYFALTNEELTLKA